MTATLTETPLTATVVEPLEVIEYDRIECGDCGKLSPFLDDADEGTEDAHDAGWHVYNLDDCGCPHHLCGDCAQDLCGEVDTTPRLFGMRVI
ncbi:MULTISPECIES: hypothetical protein [unclassified Streptomyces]|uniref:hypothetical protein n=1 Tax=unclassified Streptomyces TaxID=2593676 RepID=UPI00225105C5|nr:hypothetical protein [Streptomyces sp. NBC_01264]MCX4784138.1 hypothetical protein [Streptomyces sp. NBC_01264]